VTAPSLSGRLLVAADELLDPNFHRSVVLLVRHDPTEGALGLVLNRRTEIQVQHALGHVLAAASREESLWVGGPVDGRALWTLHRCPSLRAPGHEILPGVWSTCEAQAVEELLTSSPPDRLGGLFRLFVGYAGWSVGQLEDEIEEGAWDVVPAGWEVVFSPEPAKLWAEMRLRTRLDFYQDAHAVAKASLS
jgi:putative transcriptional regulator